jgi:hypothetical protein
MSLFNFKEFLHWEETTRENELLKVYGPKKGTLKDPIKDRLLKRRKNEFCSSGHYWRKENKWNQTKTVRKHRHTMNKYVKQGDFEKIAPFKHTCGWLTW